MQDQQRQALAGRCDQVTEKLAEKATPRLRKWPSVYRCSGNVSWCWGEVTSPLNHETLPEHEARLGRNEATCCVGNSVMDRPVDLNKR